MLEALLAIRKPQALDPNRLLLHFDGTNGSTNIVDVHGRTCTASNSGSLTTAFSKFGGASASFPNWASSIVVTDDATLRFDADFTLEFWSYLIDFSNYDSMPVCKYLSNWSSAAQSSYIEFYQGTAYLKLDGEPQPATKIVNAGALKAGQWQHIALTRLGNLYTLWIDGVAAGTRTSSATFGNYAGPLMIGNWGLTTSSKPFNYNGYIDEFRTVKGIALYTTAFTPPSAPFTS
jgi:hypothetical protein